MNLAFIATMLPLLIFSAIRFGQLGAAAVWLVLNAVYFMTGVPLTHRRLLRGETARWYLRDVGPAMAVAVLVAGVAKCSGLPLLTRWQTAITLGAVWCVTFAGTAAVVFALRRFDARPAAADSPQSPSSSDL